MQATYVDPIRNAAVTPQMTAPVRIPAGGWRGRAATWLQEVADRLETLASSIIPGDALSRRKVSHREDVCRWFDSLSGTARGVVCAQAREEQALLRIVNHLKYLPDEPTLLQFIRLVPDWATLHKQFAAYLLRRLVLLRYLGRQPEQDFAFVHRWLQRRNRHLAAMPHRWRDALNAAELRVGEEAAVLLEERWALPPGPTPRDRSTARIPAPGEGDSPARITLAAVPSARTG